MVEAARKRVRLRVRREPQDEGSNGDPPDAASLGYGHCTRSGGEETFSVHARIWQPGAMRALLALLAVALLGAMVVGGLLQAGGDESPATETAESFDLAAARQQLAGAPAPLAALHDRANELLPGGEEAFERRLAALEGHPVVINKWAAWCGPCRAEAPILQRQGVEHGRRIAFLGIDWRDSTSSARDFLERYPLPFPSYEDPEGEIATALKMPNNIPVTLFLDERGKVAYLHQGGYRTEQDLADDIDRYLPGA